MKIESQFTVTCECCPNFRLVLTSQYDAIKQLIEHIQQNHGDTAAAKEIEQAGRSAAQINNGCGYSDHGRPENDGWHHATESFRQAWRFEAYRRKLKL